LLAFPLLLASLPLLAYPDDGVLAAVIVPAFGNILAGAHAADVALLLLTP
jgi:bacteriorhodopsin